MKRIFAVLVASIATLGLLVGVNAFAADSATPKATTAVITISNFTFTGQLKVTPAQRIKVVNADSVTHTFTSNTGKFDTGEIAPGTFAILKAPSRVGKYGLHCNIHPSMKATLNVVHAGS